MVSNPSWHTYTSTDDQTILYQCYSKEPLGCLPPSVEWTTSFFSRPETKRALGVPDHVNFSALNDAVSDEFEKYGDM